MSEICVFRPALTAKKAKNGGFLRVCGCFCGRWGAFLGVIGGVKVPKRNLCLDSALFFVRNAYWLSCCGLFLLLDFMVICCIVLV